MKFLGFQILKKTLAITCYRKSKRIINNYFIQFSLKNMWKYPHREDRYDNGSYIYGWVFFYFGNIISDTNKQNKYNR